MSLVGRILSRMFFALSSASFFLNASAFFLATFLPFEDAAVAAVASYSFMIIAASCAALPAAIILVFSTSEVRALITFLCKECFTNSLHFRLKN